MSEKLFILCAMLFMHIIDDYKLQGMLSNLKQKKWWKENYPDKLYEYDYIIALLTHSFSWSFMILLPVTLYLGISDFNIIVIIINLIIHAVVDDLKANKLKINLIQDQLIHIIQVIITWLYYFIIRG